MNSETWAWDSAQDAIPDPDRNSIAEVRPSCEEFPRIERAVIAKGMTVNACLRDAALPCALQHA
jgi:hypothetical protein